jgi:predicted O-linked N-acetylglucosamine transferase (SPINDLY family)
MAEVAAKPNLEEAVRLLRAGRGAEAAELLSGLIASEPNVVEYRSILGGVLAGQGRIEQAIEVLRQAVAIAPNYPPAYYNLGNALSARGSWDEAIQAFTSAIEIDPRCAEAHHNLGSAFRAKGQIERAIDAYRRAVSVRPDFHQAFNNLGILLLSRERFAQAAEAFRGALPSGQAEPHNNLANALQGQRRFAEAVQEYQSAIQLRPDYAEAFCNLAAALRELGRLEDSIAAADRAASLRPTMAEAHLARALALIKGRQWDRAIKALEQALHINPKLAEAHLSQGNVLAKLDQPDQAIDAYQRAIDLDPTLATAHADMGNALRDRGELDQAIASYRKAASLSNEPWIGSAALYAMYFHPDFDAAQIRDESRAWQGRYAAPVTPASVAFTNDITKDRRLRIGYVSPDFRAHAIGLFLLRLMANHDHDVCQLFLYSGARIPDEITNRFRGCADVWRETAGLSDQQLADLIRADQIDVLVDVTMHLHAGRLLTFARKPAPVQVTYLAHPGTTGLASMDYRLGDRYMDPPEENQFHTEKTIRLSGSYFCYDPMGVDVPVNELPAVARGDLTFGSMNNFSKINDAVLRLWAKAMNPVPDSRLLVLAPPGVARTRLAERMKSLGVNPARIEFEGHRPREPYMRLFNRIDICLDTFPYTGHTTTLDALWMGVPVLTMPGKTAVSRGSLSILSHLQMPELIANSPEQFVQIAATLAADLPWLSSLRRELRDRLAASSLMDGPRFARSFEQAFRTAWSEYCDTGF